MSGDNITALPSFAPEVFERQPSRFRTEDFNTITAGRSPARVKGLWPKVGVCFLGGPSMAGKSFWALDALARVSRGEPVLGRKSLAAGVVYIGAEDPGGIRLRIEGLRGEIGRLDPGRFQFIGQAPDLTEPDDVADLRATLIEARDLMVADGSELGVIAIDTMSAAIPGADENTAKDMGPVLKALQDLAHELQTLVLMVAHTGKDADRGLRGWSGLLANADGLVMLDDPQGSPVRPGTVVKVKNGPAGDRFAFSLRVVEVGEDDDGDPITTCVIEDQDAPEAVRSGRKPTKAAQSAELIMRAYGRLWDANAMVINFPGADGAKGVEVAPLRAAAYDLGVGPTEPDYSEAETDADRAKAKRKWQDQRKADFDRGLDHLRSIRRLRTEVGFAWEPMNKAGAK